MKPDLTKKAIAGILEAMQQVLADAAVTASESNQAIQQGEQNQAIGAIMAVEDKLEQALALYRAALSLHRSGRA